MLLMPSIDLRGGACVRLLRGDFAAETRYELNAAELLARYRALGASWLHVVDLDGARDGARGNHALIQTLTRQPADERRRPVQLQVGGGVRNVAAIDALLDLGVARVVIGSAAAERPAEVAAWLQRYGSERLCLAFDVRLDAAGIPRVQTRGWQQGTALSLWDAVAAFPQQQLRHVLCTDIDRDGALAGPNLALYREAQQRFPHVGWQASGGIAQGADLGALALTGVAAAISGKALLEQRITVEELRPFLPNA
jgi:phosphoribosylformimino-5-aminoimidazole carboxamide ribotide isomerase